MLAKAAELSPDAFVLDLEDSVPAAEKVDAREMVVDALHSLPGSAHLAVRINGCNSRWALDDLRVVAGRGGRRLDAVVVPKVDGPEHLWFVDLVLRQVELTHGLTVGHIKVQALIETASGLAALDRMAAATTRLSGLILGTGDLASSLSMPQAAIGETVGDYPGDRWHAIRTQVLLAARSRGLMAIDGPYARIRDLDGFERVAKGARSLGFEGTWVLHPDQIDIANAVFGVSLHDVEWAYDLVQALNRAGANGALDFRDEMIDEASRKSAETILARGDAAGIHPRQTPTEVPPTERARWREEHL